MTTEISSHKFYWFQGKFIILNLQSIVIFYYKWVFFSKIYWVPKNVWILQNTELILKTVEVIFHKCFMYYTNLKLYVKCWQYDIHKTHWANLSPVPVFYDSDSFLRVVTSVKERSVVFFKEIYNLSIIVHSLY
jgi:hypothetical protein